MSQPPLITQPFAANGDQTILPATDPNGFVNFNTGYTPDYEINLAAGDPQAKAVERGIQNYLFNALTAAVMSWQQQNRPAWYSSMPGGYNKWAEVMYPTDGSATPKPYRSLVAANLTTPGSTSWEYIQGTGEMIQNIPMPTGGPNGPGSMVISTSTDFNTFTSSGTWQFQSDAVVAGSPNTPVNTTMQAAAGMLEVNSWNNGANVYVTQFFRDRNGLGFMRGATNGAWSVWKIWANAHQFVVGEVRLFTGTATDAAVQAAFGPGWHLCNGANGTPNLSGLFVLGAGASVPTGSTGGASSVTLSIGNMPAHNHVINIGDPGHTHGVSQSPHAHGVSDPGHAHGVYDPGHSHSQGLVLPGGVWNGGGSYVGNGTNNFSGGGSSNFGFGGTPYGTNAAGTGIGIYGNGTGIGIQAANANISINGAYTGITASSNNNGGGGAFSIVPPYYALAYVMYTGA